MIRFGSLTKAIPSGSHFFPDTVRDLCSYCEHFFTRDIFSKVKINVDRQSWQVIEDGEINGGSAFQGQNIGQKGIFLNKVQYLGKTTDLFESVSYET